MFKGIITLKDLDDIEHVYFMDGDLEIELSYMEGSLLIIANADENEDTTKIRVSGKYVRDEYYRIKKAMKHAFITGAVVNLSFRYEKYDFCYLETLSVEGFED